MTVEELREKIKDLPGDMVVGNMSHGEYSDIENIFIYTANKTDETVCCISIILKKQEKNQIKK